MRKIRKDSPYYKKWLAPPLADRMREAVKQYPFYVYSVRPCRIVRDRRGRSELEAQYLVRFINTWVPEAILYYKDFPWQFKDIVYRRELEWLVIYLVRWPDSWLSSSDLINAREAVEIFYNL